jgi:tRNA(fMet)-specific endonuclease VapC
MLVCNLILDTDILVALLKGKQDANRAVGDLQEKSEEVATTIISAYELLKGAYLSAKPKENLAQVQELLKNIEVYDLTLQACQEASVIYCDIRRDGCLTGEFDVLIAAIAVSCSEAIMTRDQHFNSYKALKIVNW